MSYEKDLLTTFPKFWHMASFLPPKNERIWDIFTWSILTKLKPLMTFLNKFLSINQIEIIVRIFLWKNYLTTFPNVWHMTSFWPQKWPNFDHFHQKWPILTKLTPLMTFLTELLSINLTEIIFRNFYGKNVFNGINLIKRCHFRGKCPKFAHFGGKNVVICQNFGKVVKRFFSQKFEKLFQGVYMDEFY